MKKYLSEIIAIVIGISLAYPAFATFLYPFQGGTGTSTPPTYGQVPVGNSSGTYTLTATSSLNISASSAASTTLLSDSNTFLGVDKFTNALSNFGGTWQGLNPSAFAVFSYLFPNNATSTILTFNNGLNSNASTTISTLNVTGLSYLSGFISSASSTVSNSFQASGLSTLNGGFLATASSTISATTTSTSDLIFPKDDSRLVIGSLQTTVNIAGTVFPVAVGIHDESTSVNAELELHHHNITSTNGATMEFAGTEGTEASPTTVANGDRLGIIGFIGYDGTNYRQSGRIDEFVDNTVATGQVPGRLVFTTANSSGTMTEAMRINSQQRVGIGTTTPGRLLSVNGSGLFDGSIQSTNAIATGTVDYTAATVKQHLGLTVSWPAANQSATTTTATSTINIGFATNPETWNYGICKSLSGNISYQLKDDAGNLMNPHTATTTKSQYSLTQNNSFTQSKGRLMDVGPMTADVITCTFDRTVNQ